MRPFQSEVVANPRPSERESVFAGEERRRREKEIEREGRKEGGEEGEEGGSG